MKRFLISFILIMSCLFAEAQDLSKVTMNTVWYQADSLIEQIYPVTTNGTQMNGAFKKKVQLVYNGETSNVKVKDITLYAYANAAYMQSPNNFGIIPLVSKSGTRTYQWMSASALKAKTNENMIAVTYEKVGDNVFKVKPASELAPGEYGFVNNVSGMPSIIYGFTIVE